MQGLVDRLAALQWEWAGAGLGLGLVVVAVAVRLGAPGALTAVLATGAAIAWSWASGQFGATTAVVAAAAVVAGGVLDRRGALSGPGWWPTTLVVGLAWFATVPDTEGVLAAVGAAVPLALLGAVPASGRVTVVPTLALLAVAAHDGAAGRSMALWGALAAAGGWAVLLARRPRVVPTVVVGVQVAAGLVGSRLIGHDPELVVRGLLAVVVVAAASFAVHRSLPRRLRTPRPLP